MLVVLPFHASDAEAAARNLEWAIELDGNCKHDCLISVDSETDVRMVRPLALKYFSKALDDFVYPPWTGSKDWPQPHNWAFQRLAKHISTDIHRPFFWWETDAVPIQAGFLDVIEKEWESSGMPFMGTVMPAGHMNGAGCYPANVPNHSVKAMLCRAAPWDVVMKNDTIRKTHNASHIMARILDGTKPFHFEDFHHVCKVFDPRRIVIFHGCRDDSLVRILRNQKNGGMLKQPVVEPIKDEAIEAHDDIGVVITTHNREHRCERALKSCLEAGFRDIIITATGTFDPKFDIPSHVRIVRNGKDSNSNRAWLHGVKESTSDWILILHDDDMVLPDFLTEARKHLDANFILWTARFHREKDKPSFLCVNPECHEGVRPTEILRKHLKTEGQLSVTPVRGLFKRVDLIEWLAEAGKHLPKECYLRRDFLVGNDLWIWLRASHKYEDYYSMATPIVSLGCDSDSTTASSMKTEDTAGKLRKIYDITRDIFAKSFSALKIAERPHLHIVTIVLDGGPFLLAQLRTFNRLKIDWHWSIVEGVADATKCTSWCTRIPGRLSSDGTTEMLADLEHHPRISVFRNNLWPSKVDMVNAPLKDYKKPGILMQIDVDELWDTEQLERIVQLFKSNPTSSHAMFWCRYFVGPGIVMESRNCFANNPLHEWRRAWKWAPGQQFISHEPPQMSGSQEDFIPHKITANLGLVFDHYSYVLKSQVEFKERYYGYAGATTAWEGLQKSETPSLAVFPWVNNPGELRRL